MPVAAAATTSATSTSVSTSLGLVGLLATLAVFAVIGFRTRDGATDLERYLVARGSQGPWALGLSFFASGLGAWVLFSPPEIGAVVGMTAVIGYAFASALPFAVFATLGSRLRRVVPAGHSLTEFLRLRFGRTFHIYVVAIFVLYMAVFLTAELTAVGGLVAILSGVDPTVTVLAVAVVTLAYTAYGGLVASLRTDRWQAWLVAGLLAVASVAILRDVTGGVSAALEGASVIGTPLTGLNRPAIESAVTLLIAVTAANIFHQGYWQRVWSATDEAALRKGAWIAGIGTVPVVLVAGLFGAVAIGSGLDVAGNPSASFFALLAGAPAWLAAIVLVLGVALVASSVDTLENGLASLVVSEAPRLDLRAARLVTVGLLVPTTIVAVQGLSVLRLFLIADLLAAATVVPALFGLWRRATGAGALAGSIAGLVGAVSASVITSATGAQAWAVVTFDGPPTLPPFVGALVASTVVAVGVSLLGSTDVDLDDLDARIPVLTGTS